MPRGPIWPPSGPRFPLLSVPDAARAFQVSLPTMRRWVKAGRVPTVKIGATVRVDMSRLHGVGHVEVARLAAAARGTAVPIPVSDNSGPD